MAEPFFFEFKHGDLSIWAGSPPWLNGIWSGFLSAPSKEGERIESIVSALGFDTPHRAGPSVTSTFKAVGKDPLVVMAAVVRVMRTQIPNFSDIPRQLWFTIFLIHTFIVEVQAPNKLKVGIYNNFRGKNPEFVNRLEGLKQVKSVTDNNGSYEVVLRIAISDPKTLVELGSNIANLYQAKQ